MICRWIIHYTCYTRRVCKSSDLADLYSGATCSLCPQAWRSSDVADLFFEANLLLWSVVVGVLTYRGIMSAYIPLMFVLGPLVAHQAAGAASLPLDSE